MDFIEKLKQRTKEVNSIVCMGLDPVIDKIPFPEDEKKESPGRVIAYFYLDILEEMKKQNVFPAIVKPNIAFYEQYGFEGLHALKLIITKYKEAGIPILLDAKRGDIGKTSRAYARALFDFWDADAITIAPYMGSDSVSPFLEYCEQGKGVYVLCRTSNKGAIDMQNLVVGDVPIYMKTAEKISNDWFKQGIGAVIGATYPKELEEISKFMQNKQVPFLIPGVGAQGGSATEVVKALKNSGQDISIHRINSSSGINYAYLKKNTDNYAKAAVDALKELNEEINKNLI